MVFIYLNKFKSINDTYGHLIGDKVLKYFSKQIQKELRKEDLLFRYAGDEFIILFENSNKKIILDKMLNIQKKYNNIKFKVNNKIKIDISFSFGMAKFKKNDIAKKIIKKADENMYKNKKKNNENN
jgi:diguanylate cyclase (GGDEF)-like protein